uniref:Uncharacterized protein n=1 Tax=Arundo donax TaxID=35708 RepID=A0A0A9AIB8_ARUDO
MTKGTNMQKLEEI